MSHGGSCARSAGTTASIDSRTAGPGCLFLPPNNATPITAAMPTDSITRRFAVACGVLGQYVRAGGAAPAPFCLAPPAAAAHQQQQQEGLGLGLGAAPQQLTIFYGGRVVVLDACPPEKAAELIRLAAAAQGPPAAAVAAEAALVDMPIARKASLRRFLAKRKDRSSYSSSSAAAAAYDRQDNDNDGEPAEQAMMPPPHAPKKGKMVVATRDEPAPASSSWLALGSLGDMHGR